MPNFLIAALRALSSGASTSPMNMPGDTDERRDLPGARWVREDHRDPHATGRKTLTTRDREIGVSAVQRSQVTAFPFCSALIVHRNDLAGGYFSP